jgi:hypothetical protein
MREKKNNRLYLLQLSLLIAQTLVVVDKLSVFASQGREFILDTEQISNFIVSFLTPIDGPFPF